MKRIRRRREIFPRWEMPSDPVRAVFWFTHWTVKVLVRFFWLPIIAGVITESILNGVVGGVVTFLVGLLVWAGLAGLLVVFNVSSGVSRVLSEVDRLQRQGGYSSHRRPFISSDENPDFIYREPETEGSVVEGTVTDLGEERRKRRREPQ